MLSFVVVDVRLPESVDPVDPSRPDNRHDLRRLWTPWRMRYVGAGAAEQGCLFCNRYAASDDIRSLILHRGDRAFTIMNLFPYNTGHLMLVPVAHVASPEDVDGRTLREMADLLPPTLRALRRVLRCDGFNVGFNVGADAGAGVADHLHQHLVPRWEGDANFMPILAATMVLPELIPVTYAKVRAELTRELASTTAVTLATVSHDLVAVLAIRTDDGWRLPVATPLDGEPLWRSAVRAAAELTGDQAEVVGWSGPTRADSGGIGLTLSLQGSASTPSVAPGQIRWIGADELSLLGADRTKAADALASLNGGIEEP